ncbi:TolC family outer membrane protein [Thalassomonas viridans]|uniref:TolC family outer membrane protein n=1 Tax=Thalassomonas viridans TaxID=137584 RepID=A0AAF0CAI6_9GAMM|nr:TolC family outer membrane protein [Thalassomonas viridans]WDE08592.1 TolC family outer membrane protein [Thalassomonas viridans]
MKKVIFTIKHTALAGVLSLSALYATSLKAQTLEEAVAQALDTHPDIQQAFARFKVKEEEVYRANANYLPTVDLTAGYGYEYTDSPGRRRSSLGFDDGKTELERGEFGINIRQMLFDGFFSENELDRTLSEANAEQWMLMSTAEDLALEVSKSYLNNLKMQQLITLAEDNIKMHREIYAQIKERIDSGIGSIADLSQVEGRLARAESNLIAARNNALDMRAQFIHLTNMAPENLQMPVPDAAMLPKDLESGLTSAVSLHPVIKSAQREIDAARFLKHTVKASYYPTITFEFGASSDNDLDGEHGLNRFGPDVGGHRNEISAMVRLKYNLFSGGKDQARERRAAYIVDQAMETNEAAYRRVSESYRLAWNAYEMLGKQKNYLEQHVLSAKATQLAYKEQFNLGQRSLLDLLDSERELFQARQDYLDAEFDEVSARYRLLNVTGQLLGALRVTPSAAWQGEHNYSGRAGL